MHTCVFNNYGYTVANLLDTHKVARNKSVLLYYAIDEYRGSKKGRHQENEAAEETDADGDEGKCGTTDVGFISQIVCPNLLDDVTQIAPVASGMYNLEHITYLMIVITSAS